MILDFDFAKTNYLIEQVYKENKSNLKSPDDLNVCIFPQSWEEDGELVKEYTTVIMANEKVYIYFNGEFDYVVEKVNDNFYHDLHAFDINDVMYKTKYESK